jgi:hypothetical protein
VQDGDTQSHEEIEDAVVFENFIGKVIEKIEKGRHLTEQRHSRLIFKLKSAEGEPFWLLTTSLRFLHSHDDQ